MKAARCLLYFLGSIYLFAACATQLVERIQPGMNKSEVLRYVGEPRKRVYNDDVTQGSIETWHYDRTDMTSGKFLPYWIRIQDGRVSAMGPDEERAREVERQSCKAPTCPPAQ